jgi:Luciferase-like monooxygenase
VVVRYGFEQEAGTIQDLYLGGKKLEAIRRVPDSLVDAITIAGPAGYIRDRLLAWSTAGVTLLLAAIHGKTLDDRTRTLDTLASSVG